VFSPLCLSGQVNHRPSHGHIGVTDNHEKYEVQYGTREYLGRMKAGKKGGDDSLGLVIDSESGELFCLHFLPGMEDG